jgi:hypothetical protein
VKRLATSLDAPGGITVIRRGCATDQPTLKARYLVAEAAALQARLAPQLDKGRRKTLARSIAKAQTKDDLGALARFVGVHEGQLRIVAGPSLIVPVRDLVGDAVHAEAERGLREVLPVEPGAATACPSGPVPARGYGPQGRRGWAVWGLVA